MRKSFAVIIILILAAILATIWTFLSDVILKKTHPLPYAETVKNYSTVYAVPEEIIYAVINTESSFKSDAVSNKGAVGLMQIMPETFDWLCSKNSEENAEKELLYNPEVNIKYGTYFLSLLYSEYGVWETVYAAYNAGMNTVNKWLSDPKYNDNGKLVNIPYPETAKYVEKVSKNAAIYKKLYFSDEKTESENIEQSVNSAAFGASSSAN
jgi:soluble lytic murein transglycosylase